MSVKSSNYLVFVDESGDHYLKKYPKDYPMFVLAFVIISNVKPTHSFRTTPPLSPS